MTTDRTALMVTSYAGFGDLLYLTPTIRLLANVFKAVDVWVRNPEPLQNNPHIRSIHKMDSFFTPDPWDFYYQDIYYASPSKNQRLQGFPQSNIHTVDFFTVNCLNLTLRDSEKDLVCKWTKKDEEKVRLVCEKHKLIPTKYPKGANIVTISPAITWKSRTLPLAWYKELIKKIVANGDKVVLIGKDIEYKQYDPQAEADKEEFKKFAVKECDKQLYPASEFPEAICLYNEFTMHELAAFYACTKVAINSENGNMVVSCTNKDCWNVYVPTLTAPEFRLPYREGSLQYKNIVVKNDKDYYPSATYTGGAESLMDVPILIPSVEKTFEAYKLACKGFRNGHSRVVEIGGKNFLV